MNLPEVTETLVLNGGDLHIVGLVDTEGDEVHYDIIFYEDGRRVLTFKYELYKTDDYAVMPSKLKDMQLTTAVIAMVEHTEELCMEQRLLMLGDGFDWYLENLEMISGLPEQCCKVEKINEGWIHYGPTRRF